MPGIVEYRAGRPPALIVVGGLPGTGKHTMASAVAAALEGPVFIKDDVEHFLSRYFTAAADAGAAAYAALEALARFRLSTGQPAIVVGTFSQNAYRERMSALAESCQVPLWAVECICSDEVMHRQRIARLVPGTPGWPPVTWDHVRKVRDAWEPWPGTRLVIDSSEPVRTNIARILEHVSSPI
jgi:predicted kinase